MRRAAAEGLFRGERPTPRTFTLAIKEELYLRSHWSLLRDLRAALRTEPNVQLAVLFGSTAAGTDREGSDVDLLVELNEPAIGRLAELSSRLSKATGREVQLLRLGDAEQLPALMVDVVEGGRVLIDRHAVWPRLLDSAGRWRARARAREREELVPLDA